MDTRKFQDFYNPSKCPPVHIIGCGAVGSTIATQVARLATNEIHLWDFDQVESKNIANQTFDYYDIGKLKTNAVKEKILAINPACKVHVHEEYTDQKLQGILFLAVDSIETRRNIVEINRYNYKAVAYIDIRMRLTDGQVYTATHTDQNAIENLLKTMDFTHEEAIKATPVSACGTVLNVRPIVTLLASYATGELMNIVLNGYPESNVLMTDILHQTLETIKY